MNEKTIIGGVVYESVGSSNSNLLLKCNGTARIQWGNKLIDLIKNGKLTSENKSIVIEIISDESEIKHDGIYVLDIEKSYQLLIRKNGKSYNLTNTDLYISASKQQDITAEQKIQALENIGFYYDTIEDVYNSGIQFGIVYVLENNTLYTVENGIINEFEAKLKTVTVEQEHEYGDIINGSVELVLSVDNDEYLILKDNRITVNKSIHAKDYVQIGSEGADLYNGYRLYIDGDTSCLDVDKINVRKGLPSQEYIEVTFEQLQLLINSEELQEQRWYLITDFQNHWRLPAKSPLINRPILVKALTKNVLYKEGLLFNNQDIKIHFDVTFTPTIRYEVTSGVYETVTARGRIVWMKDMFNNEANFDFLDYFDAYGKALTTLHDITDTSYLKSIFPKNSYNNKLVIYDLKGVKLKKSINSEYELDNDNCNNLGFLNTELVMHDNTLICRGLIVDVTCKSFCYNTINGGIKLNVKMEFNKNSIGMIYNSVDYQLLNYTDYDFINITNNKMFNDVIFHKSIKNLKASKIYNCNFLEEITDCAFEHIENTIFEYGIKNSHIGSIITPKNDYFYNLNSIYNSNINEISNFATFTGEIYNSTIDVITDYVELHNIYNCSISCIKTNTFIKSDLNNVRGDEISNVLIDNKIINTTFKSITNSEILNEINTSKFNNINSLTLNGNITNSVFNAISNSKISGNIDRSRFGDITSCNISSDITDSVFKQLNTCYLDSGLICNTTSLVDLYGFNGSDFPLLYNSEKTKEIHIIDNNICVISIPDVIFYRGMIVMHSGCAPIPKGWAICDGGTYEFNGVSSTTPNLKNRFIKAVTNKDDIKAVDNTLLNDKGEFTLSVDYLPEHYHPHSHDLKDVSIDISNSGTLTLNGDSYTYDKTMTAVQSVEGPDDVPINITKGDSGEYYKSDSVIFTGGDHTHEAAFNGTITESTKESTSWIYGEQKPLQLTPNYYSLIFIMKL